MYIRSKTIIQLFKFEKHSLQDILSLDYYTGYSKAIVASVMQIEHKVSVMCKPQYLQSIQTFRNSNHLNRQFLSLDVIVG